MTLEEHRIRDIKTMWIESHYPRTVGRNAQRGVHGHGSTVQVSVVTTDQDAVGWGISRMKDRETSGLIDKCLTAVFDPEVGVISPEAMGLDFPLHDLAGMILGEPVHKMLGSYGDTDVPCYDGAIYMDDLLPEDHPRGVEAVLANCWHDFELGYRAFKLKIGRGFRWMEPAEGLQRDIEVTQKVREAFPDCQILVDANDGYDCDGFLRYLDAVADYSLFWIEEPFPENWEDLYRLREFLIKYSPETVVADGESEYNVEFLLKLANEGLVDVLIMDIVGGGFTQWRQWMPRLVEVKVSASPHTWGDPLKTRYAGQIAAGLGHVLTVEGIPAVSDDVDWELYHLQEGILHIPHAPGFGMNLKGGVVVLP